MLVVISNTCSCMTSISEGRHKSQWHKAIPVLRNFQSGLVLMSNYRNCQNTRNPLEPIDASPIYLTKASLVNPWVAPLWFRIVVFSFVWKFWQSGKAKQIRFIEDVANLLVFFYFRTDNSTTVYKWIPIVVFILCLLDTVVTEQAPNFSFRFLTSKWRVAD